MKKLQKLLLTILACGMTTLMADEVSYEALGMPSLLLNDRAVLGTFPSVLQDLDNDVALQVQTGGAGNYYYLSSVYKINDMLGFAASYADDATSSPVVFSGIPAIAGSGLSSGSISVTAQTHFSSLVWGAALGDSFNLGVNFQNHFLNGTSESSTIVSNNVEDQRDEFSGFQSKIIPSLKLGLGDMDLYASVGLTLNFFGYEEQNTVNTNTLTLNPSALGAIDIYSKLVLPLNDKTKAGVSFNYMIDNYGYSIEAKTNESVTATNFDVEGGKNSFDIILGLETEASEKLTLFADAYIFGLGIENEAHSANAKDFEFNQIKTLTFPSLSIAANLELLKWLNFMVSANPTWTKTITQPKDNAEGDNGASPNRTVVDDYNLTTTAGLGLNLGDNLTVNAAIIYAWFEDLVTNPFATAAGGIFDSGSSQPWFSKVQFTYTF